MTTLFIRGGTVVNADRAFKADVITQDGKIVAVGENLTAPAGATSPSTIAFHSTQPVAERLPLCGQPQSTHPRSGGDVGVR